MKIVINFFSVNHKSAKLQYNKICNLELLKKKTITEVSMN